MLVSKVTCNINKTTTVLIFYRSTNPTSQIDREIQSIESNSALIPYEEPWPISTLSHKEELETLEDTSTQVKDIIESDKSSNTGGNHDSMKCEQDIEK